MRLSEVEIRPGYVRQVLDNKGTIKAVVEGLFNEQDLDLLPPIRLFFTLQKGAFSAPRVNDPIWVFYQPSNPQDLRWVRQADCDGDIMDICAKGNKNTEVLMRRKKGLENAQIYYADSDGMVIQNQESSINIDKDSNICLSTGDENRTIEVSSSGISLGTKGGSAEHAVKGESLLTALLDLNNLLVAMSTACKSNPYTVSVATVIDQLLPQYQKDIQKILSENVTLD